MDFATHCWLSVASAFASPAFLEDFVIHAPPSRMATQNVNVSILTKRFRSTFLTMVSIFDASRNTTAHHNTGSPDAIT